MSPEIQFNRIRQLIVLSNCIQSLNTCIQVSLNGRLHLLGQSSVVVVVSRCLGVFQQVIFKTKGFRLRHRRLEFISRCCPLVNWLLLSITTVGQHSKLLINVQYRSYTWGWRLDPLGVFNNFVCIFFCFGNSNLFPSFSVNLH